MLADKHIVKKIIIVISIIEVQAHVFVLIEN